MNRPDDLVLRAIDANVNRTQEALRVAEDALRFVCQESRLTNVCKQLRHGLASWASVFDRDHLLAARDAGGDVGRQVNVKTEYSRDSVSDLVAANLVRAQQSLRSLEEFSKTIDGALAASAEALRYQVYDLDRAVAKTFASQRHLANRSLYVLVDSCQQDQDQFRRRVKWLCQHGADIIQLRDKSLHDRQLFQFAEILVNTCRKSQVISVINDRVDIASSVRSDAVHLGQDDLSVSAVRRIADPKMLIGVSTHSIRQARQAARESVDYIGVGPTFQSSTKSFESFTGIELLKQVSAEIGTPAFAIGGITLENLPQVLGSGITRIAVSAAVLGAQDQVARTMNELRSALKKNARKAAKKVSVQKTLDGSAGTASSSE